MRLTKQGSKQVNQLISDLQGSECPYGQATASLLAASLHYVKGDYDESLVQAQAGLEYLLMKPGQRKALNMAGMILRIHFFLLNSKVYSKLAILQEKQPMAEEVTSGLI